MGSKRSIIFGGAFLVPVLALLVWFVSAAPNRCSLYENLGYVYLAKGTLAPPRTQLRTAEHWFSESLVAGCQAAPATYGLGQVYSGLGQTAAAVTAFRSGDEHADLRRFLIGKLYDDMGREADASREFETLPRDAAAHFYRLGNRADSAGDAQKALYYYSLSATINPAAPKAYYASAFVYWRRLGEQDKAAQMIRRALAVDPTPSAQRELYRGLLCYYEDKMDCAQAAWASAARYPPSVDTGAGPQYLAYEMLGRALVASRTNPPRQGTVVFR